MQFASFVDGLTQRLSITDAQTLIRATHGRAATRWVATEMGIAPRTARRWLGPTPPASRQGTVLDLAAQCVPPDVRAAQVMRGSAGHLTVGSVAVSYDGTGEGTRTIGEVDIDLAPVISALENGAPEYAQQAFGSAILEAYGPGLGDLLDIDDFLDGIALS